MFSFKINVGTSHFPKSRTCNCVCDTLNKYEILKIVSAFFFKSQISAETCTDSPVKTQTAQHSQNTYVEICAWLNLKKSIWKKNALTLSRISYFSRCHLHSYMFLLLKMWCSQVAFGNEHAFWERTFFFDIEKYISFFWWCYLIFYTFLCCGYLWYLC